MKIAWLSLLLFAMTAHADGDACRQAYGKASKCLNQADCGDNQNVKAAADQLAADQVSQASLTGMANPSSGLSTQMTDAAAYADAVAKAGEPMISDCLSACAGQTNFCKGLRVPLLKLQTQAAANSENAASTTNISCLTQAGSVNCPVPGNDNTSDDFKNGGDSPAKVFLRNIIPPQPERHPAVDALGVRG